LRNRGRFARELPSKRDALAVEFLKIVRVLVLLQHAVLFRAHIESPDRLPRILSPPASPLRLLNVFASESTFTLRSSFRCLTFSDVRSISVLFHPYAAGRHRKWIAILISGARVYPASLPCQT
jgi:hypothetical protein